MYMYKFTFKLAQCTHVQLGLMQGGGALCVSLSPLPVSVYVSQFYRTIIQSILLYNVHVHVHVIPPPPSQIHVHVCTCTCVCVSTCTMY